MRVPLTIADHLQRAELVYPDRVGVVDESDQPAPSWGDLTYRRVAELARGQAAALDALGVGRGERIAIVSQNAARLLVSLFGVGAWGRVLVPINFRLNAAEVGYIVEHSGASVLLIDPELEGTLADVDAKHRFIIGGDTDEQLWPTAPGTPERGRARQDATHHHYRAAPPPPPAAAHPRNLVDQRRHVGCTPPSPTGTLPPTLPCSTARLGMRRAAAWAPTCRAAQGRRRRDLGPGRTHGVSLCGAPAVVAASSTPPIQGTGDPGRGPRPMWAVATPPHGDRALETGSLGVIRSTLPNRRCSR